MSTDQETQSTPTDEVKLDDDVARKDSPSVSAVNIKLPPFWPHDPTLWFAQIEATFDTMNVRSQARKFAYVVSSLQPEYAQEIRDILISPPAQDRYDALKSELIKRTSSSEQKRLQQLLTSEELGDRKPSQLLRRMQQLMGSSTLQENLLKQLFLQRLPQNAQLILASTRDAMDIAQLADLADKIMETSSHAVSTLAAFSSAPATAPPAPPGDIQRLQAQISHLTTQVQALSSRLMDRGRSGDRHYNDRRQRSDSRGAPSRRSPSQQQGECWYHRRYGANAHKCESPCSYTAPPSADNNAAQGNGQASS